MLSVANSKSVSKDCDDDKVADQDQVQTHNTNMRIALALVDLAFQTTLFGATMRKIQISYSYSYAT